MNKLTKEQVQAFIDDLAYIQEKHGVILCHTDTSNVILEPRETYPETSPIVWAKENQPYESWEVLTCSDYDFLSIDPRELSAHGKLTKEAGLRG